MIIPNNLKEAIKELDKELLDEYKEYLLEHGSLAVHHSLGRWIRNTWRLWNKEDTELKKDLRERGYEHPDDMSNYIIEKFIDYLKTLKELKELGWKNPYKMSNYIIEKIDYGEQ